MKKYLVIFILFWCTAVLTQNLEVQTNRNNEPRNIMTNNHDPNLKSFAETYFYKSKKD